jgi:Acyl-CoA dehydrogenase, C-terminal domain
MTTLAPGLADVLAGLDIVATAPGGVAVVPLSQVPDGAQVVPNDLAAREGLALVRIPGADGPGLVGRRAAALAEVRLAVLRQMLELAVARLAGRSFAGVPLIEQQLVIGALADVVTGAELASSLADDAPAVARHEWLTEAGWTVTKFFGAEGYIADHPVRSLYVSTLVADVWIARVPESGR